jgi:hypothetical protein
METEVMNKARVASEREEKKKPQAEMSGRVLSGQVS